MTDDADRRLQAARVRLQAGDAAGTERTCGEILRQFPDHPGALHLLGLALVAMGRPGEAVGAFRQLLRRDPGSATTHLNLGNALAGQGRREEALASYHDAVALDPGLAVAHVGAGRQHKLMGRLGQAEAALRSALAVDPALVDGHFNLGLVHHQQKRLDDAAACFRKTLSLDPDHLLAKNNLGGVLRAQGEHDEAAVIYRDAMNSHPRHPEAYVNLGGLEAERGHYAESQAWLEQALVLDPENPMARGQLGNTLAAQHSWDLAITQYSRALAADPGLVDVKYNLGLVRLFRHDFERGWPGYEHRIDCAQVRTGMRKGAETLDLYERLPRWRGPVEEPRQEVAVWAEQSIGDQVLFSTLLPELVATGTPFLYEVDPRLQAAYERAFPGVRFLPLGKPPLAPLQIADRVLLAGSLPRLFRPARESFSRQPPRLLAALPQRVERYRESFAGHGRSLKVALSWKSSNAKVRLGPDKSAPLAAFACLLRVPGTQFVDVQYGDTAAERREAEAATGTRLLRFDDVDHYNELEELLAILEACDLVITTSNATAHLAGALGKRTWLLFPADRPPFYYWAHGGTHRSLWYPAVEIVTAPGLAEWNMLIEHTARKLAAETA